MFSICFGANAIAIVISATSAVRFAHPEQALYRGSVEMVIASFLLCVALCAGCSFWIYEVLLLALLSMLGLTFTASNTLAMDSERAMRVWHRPCWGHWGLPLAVWCLRL